MIYGTPTIVTNGLVLNLDAASPKAAPTRNLFTYTTDLTYVGWSKFRCSVTASAAIAPDGTNTAFALNMSTGSTDLKRLTAPTVTSAVAGGLYTLSLYVKQNNFSGSGNDTAGIQLGNYNNGQTAGTEPAFNVLSNFQTTGSFVLGPVSSGSAVARGVIDAGNGWYRIYTTCNWSPSINAFSTFFDLDNGTVTGSQYAGTGIYIWGPQFEAGYLSPYQPVSGTTGSWPSIGSTITGSMFNNPTWISSNGGSVVFDGVNDYVDLNSNSILSGSTAFTIESFYRTTGTSNGAIFSNYGPGYTSNSVWFAGRYGIYINSSVYVPNSPLPLGTYCMVATRDISGNVNLYVNNVLVAAGSLPGSIPTNINYRIGSDVNTFGEALTGNLYTLKVYNRALSQAEITQNYNALKSRFGLT